MKKLLALVLVCVLASVSNAGLFFTVGGVDAGNAITLPAAGPLALGISTNASVSQNFTFAVACSTADGAVVVPGDGTEYVGALDGDKIIAAMYPNAVTNGVTLPVGEDGSFGFMMFDGSSVAASALFSKITLQANKDVIVKLYLINNDSFQVDAIADALAVTVPEPATMALLALGGLLFRRK